MVAENSDSSPPGRGNADAKDDRGPVDRELRVAAAAPELLLCAALVASGRADSSAACLIFDAGDRHGLATTDAAAESSVTLEFSLWEGPGPEVIATGQPVRVRDLSTEEYRWPHLVERSAATPIRSSAVLPLLVGDVGVGLFTAHRYRVQAFDDEELQDLTALSRAMGVLAAVHLHGDSDRLPPTSVSRATGMVMERWQVSAADAMALLRARALTEGTTVPALATALVGGAADLGLPPASSR